MTQEQIKEVEKYNEWILKCLSKYPVETHFNRMLGKYAQTIWVVYDDFEIGIIPFGGAINFGVQIKREGHRRYYNETYLNFPTEFSHYFSKSIRWTLDMLVGKLKAQFTRPNYSRERINLTDGVLDLLGFGEYWDSNGDYGTRTLKFSNGEVVTIVEQCENEDDSFGYAADGRFVPNHYWYNGSFNTPSKKGVFNLNFLDDLFFVIDRLHPNCKPEFVAKVIDLKMGHGLDLKNDKLQIKTFKGGPIVDGDGKKVGEWYDKAEEEFKEMMKQEEKKRMNFINNPVPYNQTPSGKGWMAMMNERFDADMANQKAFDKRSISLGVDPANIGDGDWPTYNRTKVVELMDEVRKEASEEDFRNNIMSIRPYFNSRIMEEKKITKWDEIKDFWTGEKNVIKIPSFIRRRIVGKKPETPSTNDIFLVGGTLIIYFEDGVQYFSCTDSTKILFDSIMSTPIFDIKKVKDFLRGE